MIKNWSRLTTAVIMDKYLKSWNKPGGFDSIKIPISQTLKRYFGAEN